MKSFLLIIFSFVTFSCSAQTYSEQFDKCTKLYVANQQTDDSIYAWSIYRRDSCLTGVSAPVVKVRSLNGKLINLQQYKGNTLFLYFWGISCKPCVNSIPELNKLVSHFAGKKVIFLSFASNTKQDLSTFFKKIPFRFTTIPNSDKIASETFKISDFVPYTVIIDRNGKIFKLSFGSLGNETFRIYAQDIYQCLEN